MLERGFTEGGETYLPQSWLRLPVGEHLSARVGAQGCRVWVKEGHLRSAQAKYGPEQTHGGTSVVGA
jgi:hypothetical protein